MTRSWPLMAHRVISSALQSLVAIGALRTLSRTHHLPGNCNHGFARTECPQSVQSRGPRAFTSRPPQYLGDPLLRRDAILSVPRQRAPIASTSSASCRSSARRPAQAAHQERTSRPGGLGVHADRDGVVEKQTGERGAGELAALIGTVMRCVCGAVCEQCLPLLSFFDGPQRKVGRLNRR